MKFNRLDLKRGEGMESHKIQKSGKIEYKVFKKEDLENLINVLLEYKNEINHERTDLDLKIKYKDGTTRSGPYTSILNDKKLIKSVQFMLYNFRIGKKIYIKITDSYGDFEVEGTDENWVDAKFAQLTEIFNTTPKQNRWLSAYRYQYLIAATIGLTLGLLLYYSFFARIADQPALENTYKSFGFIWVVLFMGYITSHLLLHFGLFKLYPVIEFDTTREHINSSKKRKRAFWTILALVGLPLTLNYISSLIF